MAPEQSLHGMLFWIMGDAAQITDPLPTLYLLGFGVLCALPIARDLNVLARGDVHDATLEKHMVSVTEVRMSPDLRHATVFVKPLLGREEAIVLKALRTNTAYLQREVAARVKMKYAAKLKFLSDESFDEGQHIDTLLRDPHVARDLTEGE